MSLNLTYFSTLTTSAAILAIKIMVVHLATVRSRLLANYYAQPQDNKSIISPIFKIVLCCFGSDFGGVKFVERAERISKNCAENEPFFLVLATIGGLSGAIPTAPSGMGRVLIQVYTIARCAHTAVFLLGETVNTSVRSVTYTIGVFATLGMAGLAMSLPGLNTPGGSSSESCVV